MSEKEFLLNFACIELSHAKEILDESKKMLHDADILVESAEKHLKDVFCANETH